MKTNNELVIEKYKSMRKKKKIIKMWTERKGVHWDHFLGFHSSTDLTLEPPQPHSFHSVHSQNCPD